jgi:putative ABC transport system permease protein
MAVMPRLISLWRNLFKRAQVEQELTQEVESYLEMLIEAKIGEGLDPKEARRAALIEMGGVEQVKERVREVRMGHLMETVWQDLRYTARMLLKNPGFTLIAIITLALGIGANSAIFSVVDAVLLRPLLYEDPNRLMALWAKNDTRGLTQRPLSYPNFVDWREQNQVFEYLAAVRQESFSLTDGDEPERVSGVRVTTDILPLLGVRPLHGRDFLPEEARPEKAQVALIGYGLWQRRYGGDPDLIGQAMTLDNTPHTIIGVLPDWLKHPGLPIPATGAEVWIPFVPLSNEQNRSFANIRIIGRMRPDVTLSQAEADMQVVAERLEQQYPNDNTNLRVEMKSLHEELTGRVRLALLILLGAVAVVLLIACVNVANLLLARASVRKKEMAIRSALGAGRWRLLRQSLTECLLLSLAGGLAGLLLAYAGVNWLTKMNAGNLPRTDGIGVNWQVLLFTLGVSVLTGVVFGLVPALQSSRLNLTEALKDGHKGTAGGVHNRRWLGGLVVTEVALALILLSGAGLLIRSFRHVSETDPSFNPERLLTLSVPLPLTGYETQQKQALFYERTLEKINALPGVESAACVSRVPLVGMATAIFTAQGNPMTPGTEPNADYRTVSPTYFRTAGVPLLAGREFTEQDNDGAPDAIIVNEELARLFFPGESAVGKRLQLALERTRFREIVGVVGNAKLAGLDAKVDPAIYVPFHQNTWPHALRNSSLVVRTTVEPHSLTQAIRGELRSIDPALPVTQVRTMEEIIHDSMAQRRFSMSLLLVFAAVAAALSAVGIYGVMSYGVTQRSHELGVRVALGAGRADILRMVMGGGARLTLLGVMIGTAGAVAVTRLMSGLLYEVSATDPLTLGVVALLLAGVSLLACYVPARRATKVDPMTALRSE